MTELQRYIAEEVAEDHADGILTRREAMRRLGLLGLTAPAATTLLATFAAGAAPAATKPTTKAKAAFSRGGPATPKPITFPGVGGRTLQGAWAPVSRPRGGVLVIHENRGLNDHIRMVAGRFAANGFAALALDLLSEEGGTGAFGGDDGKASAALAAAPPERFDADMKAGVTEIRRRLGARKRIGAIGFCFGGGLVWRLLAAKEKRLSAAAPFYGPWPQGANLDGINAAVLGVYGGLDNRVNSTRDAALAAVRAAKVPYHFMTFTTADHAFFNDTGPRYNAPSAAEAYRRVIDWYERYLVAA